MARLISVVLLIKENEAIRQDLIEYLSAAKQILKDAFAHYPLAILDELSFRIDKYLSKLLGGMDSGDETGILEFMKIGSRTQL
jgi:hypothetical protein